jgi:hypothetical protein
LLQDLIYKIKFPLKIKTFKGDKYFRYLKFGASILPFVNSAYENRTPQHFNNIFTDHCGVDTETAEKDTCKTEHILSKETFEKIENLMGEC